MQTQGNIYQQRSYDMYYLKTNHQLQFTVSKYYIAETVTSYRTVLPKRTRFFGKWSARMTGWTVYAQLLTDGISILVWKFTMESVYTFQNEVYQYLEKDELTLRTWCFHRRLNRTIEPSRANGTIIIPQRWIVSTRAQNRSRAIENEQTLGKNSGLVSPEGLTLTCTHNVLSQQSLSKFASHWLNTTDLEWWLSGYSSEQVCSSMNRSVQVETVRVDNYLGLGHWYPAGQSSHLVWSLEDIVPSGHEIQLLAPTSE